MWENEWREVAGDLVEKRRVLDTGIHNQYDTNVSEPVLYFTKPNSKYVVVPKALLVSDSCLSVALFWVLDLSGLHHSIP